MRFGEPLARLYHYVVPLGVAVRRSIEWRRESPQERRLRRAGADPLDTIEISAEATLRFAALTFDPRSTNVEEAKLLVRMLWINGAIDRHTEQAIYCALTLSQETAEQDETNRRHDLIAALEQLETERRFTRYIELDIAIALDIMRTINVHRRGLPRPTRKRV